MNSIEFNGSDYSSQLDKKRLSSQLLRVFNLMIDGRWRTLDKISMLTGDPQASISAQLRHLRKPKFGRFTIEKRRADDRGTGLFEYKLINDGTFPKDIIINQTR